MFTCSICDETFVGIHHNSTYTTQCGHVFHHKCLMSWLKRSKTCPHCRSLVLENNLVKLFLQVDSNAQEIWNRKTDDEINSLREQLKSLKDKDIRNSSSIFCLETQLKHTKSALRISNRSTKLFKNEAEDEKKKNVGISAELKLKTVRYNESEIDRKKFKAGYLLLQSKIKSLNRELYDLQSSNSSYIDKLKSEIADLKSEKAYFENRCYNIENMNIEQPSTSKMNIENKNAISLQNQTKNEYYGHDPQLQLSTKQFLLGCVFLFVDVQIQQEVNSKYNNTILSKDNIIKYGGSVEQLYSDHITHVICVTQKHHIVEEAINDGKRCVTDYWLSDIISKKLMIPPWLAVHFPMPYSTDNLPCLNFQFSIVNFGTNECHIIKTMIELVGGDHTTNDVTSRTDIVVSLKLEGELVEKALEINKPVVNVQWLNDILFGARLGIKEPGNLKYQQFDLCNPFSVNYDMVSHLMESWKTPLIFLENQEVHDLTLNPDSPTKCKRQKTISETQEILINDEIDDINDNDVIITYIKNLPSKPCVMFCGFTREDKEILKMILLLFGGIVATHCFEATHLIMNKPITSIEFFGCLSTVKYILNENWLKDSHSSLKLLDEKEYFIENIQDQFLGLCYVPAILENNMRRLLFKYLSFFVTPGITYPSAHSLMQIITSAGGAIERTRRSLESIRSAAPNSYFIISCQEDHYLYNDLLGIYNVVYLPEFITCSILAQHVQLQKFLLEVTAQN
ncbi:PREDICTED: PAX-interacting protein 1-like isoform X2 [Diuraphis noxia]|nr:PREDICTED: PAX-interacting protein 1-like isoform X2 [Diuraphis noxia]